MRYKPLRGEKHKTTEGATVKVLEVMGNGKGQMVKVLTEKGVLTQVPKSALILPVIDTAFYERVE